MCKCLSNNTKLPPSALEYACYISRLKHGNLMKENSAAGDPALSPDRWTLIRDIAVLQVKLLVDGVRDLLLVPVSIVVGIISLMKSGTPGSQFYDLLHFGKQSEKWINLFGAADHVGGSAPRGDPFAGKDIDFMVKKVEAFVVEEYKKGGLTAQAKEHLDKVLDTVSRKRGDRRSAKKK